MFVYERRGRGLLDRMINALPIELHIPGGYKFCGPGTKLEERMERGDIPKNELDAACREHDITYAQSKDLKRRHEADKILGEKAWKRFRSADAGVGEKTAALAVSGAMKVKRKLGMGSKKKRIIPAPKFSKNF